MNLTSISKQTFCYKGTYKDMQVTTLLFCVFLTIMIVLTVSGNLLVIISISHFKLLQTPSNILILSLATSDLMVGLTTMPFHILGKICLELNSIACFVFMVFSYHVLLLSIYNVSLISLDRFYALTNPFKYSKNVSFKTMSVIIGIMWLLTFMYNFLSLYFTGPCSGDRTSNTIIWAHVDFLVAFLFPCCLIIILYIKIFIIVRKHAKSIEDFRGRYLSKKSNNRDIMANESEHKAAKKLGVLVIVYIMCLLPHFLFMQASMTVPDELFDELFHATLTIVEINSVINPIIYALSYPWFLKSVKLIFTRRIFSKDSSLIDVLRKSG